MTTPEGAVGAPVPPDAHPPSTQNTAGPPDPPTPAALTPRRATAPYVLLTPPADGGPPGGLPTEGARITRSRSTPALEDAPRMRPGRRVVRHTRYIRAASEEAGPHPLLSAVCAAEERGRRRSLSGSGGRAGGSMSVGSSTESLNALLPDWSGARGRRGSSQESTASTASSRSLRAVSGRPVTTTIGRKPHTASTSGSGSLGMTGSGAAVLGRRGAKLNPEIRAPWLEGSSPADKTRRVAAPPSLPTIGAGPTRVSLMRSARVSSGCLERVAPADIPKHLEELERRLGIHATVMAAAVRREVAAEVAAGKGGDVGTLRHDDDVTSGVLTEAELGHVTSAITGRTPTSAATSLTATAILKDVGDISEILHPGESRSGGHTEIAGRLAGGGGGGAGGGRRPGSSKVTSPHPQEEEEAVTMETAVPVGRGAPGGGRGEEGAGGISCSSSPSRPSLSGRLPPPPGAPPPSTTTTTTSTTTSAAGLLETEINDALDPGAAGGPALGGRRHHDDDDDEMEIEVEVIPEVNSESLGRDGVYVGAPPTGDYTNFPSATRHPSALPQVGSSLPESVFSAYEDYVRPAGSTAGAEGGQVGVGLAREERVSPRADNMAVSSPPPGATSGPVTMDTDHPSPGAGEGAQGVRTSPDLPALTPADGVRTSADKPKLKGILKRPTTEFKEPATPAKTADKHTPEPVKPITEKTEEPAKTQDVTGSGAAPEAVSKDVQPISDVLPKPASAAAPEPEIITPEVPRDKTETEPPPEVPVVTPVPATRAPHAVLEEPPVFPTFSDLRSVHSLDPSSLDLRMRLTFLDVLINFLLLTPLTVLHYHATCRLLAALFLGVLPRLGAWLLLLTGTGIQFALHFWQRPLAAAAPKPEVGAGGGGDANLPFVLACKAYNLVLGVGSVCHLLAVCTLVDLYVGPGGQDALRTAVTSAVVLWALRCGRNVLAPPLWVGLDADDDPGVFAASTMFKVEPDQSAESAADILGTVGVVMSFVHLHWAGLWTLMDAAIFPASFWLSMLTSLLLGSAICIVFLLLQQPAMEISRNLERQEKEVPRIAFENVFVTTANVGVVLFWRGLWMAYDVMEDYFPIYCRSWDITPLAASVLSFLLLALAHCSSCVLFKGCEVDGELRGGRGVRFTTAYFTEILRGHLEDIEDTSRSGNNKQSSPKEFNKITIPNTKQTPQQQPRSPNGTTNTTTSVATEPKLKTA